MDSSYNSMQTFPKNCRTGFFNLTSWAVTSCMHRYWQSSKQVHPVSCSDKGRSTFAFVEALQAREWHLFVQDIKSLLRSPTLQQTEPTKQKIRRKWLGKVIMKVALNNAHQTFGIIKWGETGVAEGDLGLGMFWEIWVEQNLLWVIFGSPCNWISK